MLGHLGALFVRKPDQGVLDLLLPHQLVHCHLVLAHRLLTRHLVILEEVIEFDVGGAVRVDLGGLEFLGLLSNAQIQHFLLQQLLRVLRE